MDVPIRKKAKTARRAVPPEPVEEVFHLLLSNSFEVHITPASLLPKRPFTTKEGEIHRSDFSWTGGTVWYASEMLARFLSREPDRVKSKRVLDLGAGCGLLGIVSTALGARLVTLTDEVLYVASHNVDANFAANPDLHGIITVQQLSWGNKKQIAAAGEPYDVIVMSDTLYSDYDFKPLADTIIALSRPGTCVLCATPYGMPGDPFSRCSDFYWHLEQHGFQMGEIPTPIINSLESGTGCDRGHVRIAEMHMGEA